MGFARVGGEKGTAPLLSYTGILAQNSAFRAFVSCLIRSDTQKNRTQILYYRRQTLPGGGGGSEPKLRVCKKRTKLYYFLALAVNHKLASKTQQIVHKFCIIVRHCLGVGESAPKMRVCKKKTKLYYFLALAVYHKLASQRFRNIIKCTKVCHKSINNTYIPGCTFSSLTTTTYIQQH